MTDMTTSDTTASEGGTWLARVDWLWADTRAKVALGWILVVLFVAVFAPLLAPVDPTEQDLRSILVGPSGDHLLGTDDVGRDYFSRLLYGARVSMFGSFLAVLVSLVLGVPVGLIAGYLGGVVDNVLMRLVDSILGFPAIEIQPMGVPEPTEGEFPGFDFDRLSGAQKRQLSGV